jgi:hypothetical protein
MADEAGNQILFPVIRYRDPDAAIEWLSRAFGVTERVVYRDDSGKVMHAELELGSGMIMLGQADRSGWMGGGGRDDRPRADRPELRLARVQRPRPRGESLVVRDLQPGRWRRVSRERRQR